METTQPVNLFVTFVEKEGPFLKVWGQVEKSTSIYVEQFLLGATLQFEQGVGKVDNLHVGTLICAKYKDNKYYRARITNIDHMQQGCVEVSFLDYGNKGVVPCTNIRNLQNFPTSFISIPPLATGFIFAEAHCPGGGEWNEAVFENLLKELRYREVQCTILAQATQYYLVRLFFNGTDLCPHFISRGLMQPISLQAQQAVLLSMSMQRQNQNVIPPINIASSGINTYKAATLEPGCQYAVYVSYVNDGPCHFSVQLKQSEDVLVVLMNDINSMVLKLLEEVPIPGTICLARCQEDRNICRAVVTNEVDNQFKVFYVDFGNYEVVPLESLFQIPFKYVLPKVMAVRFALAGVEKSSLTIEMQCSFKKFVDNRLLHMRVLPSPTRMPIPKCELWDPETNISALDVLLRAATNAYPEPIQLNRGFSQPVKVSYVFSCNRFFVQLSSKENELAKLMVDLQESCQTNETVDLSSMKVGLPCCVLYSADNQWYRSEIVEIHPDGNVQIRYIDFGNEETVSADKLKFVDGEQLTVLRPQAIECCLNGYQNMEVDLERDNILENLILEQQFTMKVVEMLGKKALVELFDEANYNVASLLLDKIAASKSQVSPMLVQAGHRIEHRKNYSQHNQKEQFSRTERKSPREQNDKPWNDNRSSDNSWRNDKEFRNNDKNSNDDNDQAWRQNNKGFNRNNDRFNGDSNRYNRNRNDWQNNDRSNDNRISPNSNHSYNGSNSPPRDNRSFNRNNKDRFNNDDASRKPFRGGFKREGSEVSSSGSEKSFQRSGRTSSRNSNNSRRFDKKDSESGESQRTSKIVDQFDAAPSTAQFTQYDMTNGECSVLICWFHNPQYFYCQLSDVQQQFQDMMNEIQQAYKNRQPESMLEVGAPIIGLFPEDKVLYRARVLERIGFEYKIYYVDFGNTSVVSKVWRIEKKFMELPAQAICCGLHGIFPVNDSKTWLSADNYSKYFDKQQFTSKFLVKDDEKYSVELISSDGNIKELLFNDGLCMVEQTFSNKEVEISLLIEQQFRATLKSVNNLSDIIIALECGLALNCKMNNLENATETYLDILKSYLEKIVIVYVNDIEDNTLIVTFYDNEGSKLVVLNPDEGSYDSVEPLCPLLILRSVLRGYVSHARDTSIFIQPNECAETNSFLLEQMFEKFENLTEDSAIVPEESKIYAVRSQDANWYRGRVIDFDDERTLVRYIDFGNDESVTFSELRELTPEFIAINELCIGVNVSVSSENLIGAEVEVEIYYGETGWEGVIKSQVEPPIQTEVVQEIIQPEITTTETEILLTEPTKSSPVTNISEMPGTQVLVSHIDSPNDFYIQLASATNSIKELHENLQTQIVDMAVLENPSAGILCAAPFSVDHEWYRAQILDADDDITTVRFVDYGNTDVIDNNTTKIKTLPPNLLSLEVYATRCTLRMKPAEEEWSVTATKVFEALTTNELLTAQFIDQDEKTNYIELFSDGINIREALIKQKLAAPDELTVDNKITCFVSNLNSPSEFWIQLENCVDELEWIAEQLNSAETFPELDILAPGTLCAALFPDDEMWYRARILSNTVAGIELLFIDYGNSCTGNNLRQLPEHLIVTAPLAQKCSLQRPEGLPYWTPQAIDKFNEIAADGKTIFTLRKISAGEAAVVQLFVNGEDIAEQLLPITEVGYIKNIESFDSFNIEKNGVLLEPKYKLEVLPGFEFNEDSFNKFQEINNNGKTLFQIEFLAEDTVRLYLNKSDIRTELELQRISNLSISNESETEEKIKTEIEVSNQMNHSADNVAESTLISTQTDEDTMNKETDGFNLKNSSQNDVVEVTEDGSNGVNCDNEYTEDLPIVPIDIHENIETKNDEIKSVDNVELSPNSEIIDEINESTKNDVIETLDNLELSPNSEITFKTEILQETTNKNSIEVINKELDVPEEKEKSISSDKLFQDVNNEKEITNEVEIIVEKSTEAENSIVSEDNTSEKHNLSDELFADTTAEDMGNLTFLDEEEPPEDFLEKDNSNPDLVEDSPVIAMSVLDPVVERNQEIFLLLHDLIDKAVNESIFSNC